MLASAIWGVPCLNLSLYSSPLDTRLPYKLPSQAVSEGVAESALPSSLLGQTAS